MNIKEGAIPSNSEKSCEFGILRFIMLAWNLLMAMFYPWKLYSNGILYTRIGYSLMYNPFVEWHHSKSERDCNAPYLDLL